MANKAGALEATERKTRKTREATLTKADSAKTDQDTLHKITITHQINEKYGITAHKRQQKTRIITTTKVTTLGLSEAEKRKEHREGIHINGKICAKS